MSIRATEDSLYRDVPPFFLNAAEHSERRGKLKANSSFASEFLAKHLPRKRLRQNEHEVDVHQGFMLDNAVRKPSSSGALQCVGTPRPRGMQRLSARQLRKAALFDVPKDMKFQDFMPLHTLWLQYMDDALHLKSSLDVRSADVQSNLLKADYHGCLLTVQRSKCPSYVGLEGIVIQETQNAFKMSTRDRGIKTIPKKNSIFVFQLRGYEFQLFGNHFATKPAERASKKFKAKSTIDL